MRNALVVGIVLVLTISCAPSAASTALPSRDPLAGEYAVRGGGAAKPVLDALAAGFRVLHPDVRFAFEDVGSTAGMRLVASGDVDLATSSATPAPEVAGSLTVVPVGARATVVIVNSQNPVTGLSRTQVRDVFAGAITDWSALGGPSARIFVVAREPTSALRGNFEAYFFGGKGTYARDAIEVHSSDEALTVAVGHAGVIAMITADERVRGEPRVRALAVDGITPSRENIANGTYPVRRQLSLVYNASRARPAIVAFMAFVRSDEGQRIIDHVATSTE